MKTVYIIGGGYSLKDFDFEKIKYEATIAVNKSAIYVPNLDYFITMDFTALKKIPPLKESKTTRIFVANFNKPYLQEKNGQIIDTRFGLVYTLQDFDMIIKSKREPGFGFTFKEFRSGNNSGFCALQLAYLLGYDEIYLLGIDLNIEEETHFHGGYGESKEKFQKKLDEYYMNFATAISQIPPNVRVYICSKSSRLNGLLPYREI
jgi:hypothetical protein